MNAARFLVVLIALVWAAHGLLGQEAVDLDKATTPSEPAKKPTFSEDEVTPTPIPAKPTAKKAERKQTEETATAEKPKKSVSEVMRPEEFKAAGLDKLDEDELQHLDAWLQGYRQSTEKKAAQQAEVKATEQIKKVKEEAAAAAPPPASERTRMDSLVSRVDGTFSGLKGRTLIRLEDGTVWKQADRDAIVRSAPIDHPAAVVLHTTFGYKMRVEGVGNDFYVDPVKTQ